MNIAVILSSGQGKRMRAGKNKTLLTLHRKPLIFHTINNFEKSSNIDAIILVCRNDEITIFKSLVKRYKFKKIINIIPGGKERQDSGYNAVSYLDKTLSDNLKESSIILFHNGANPFVSQKEIDESIQVTKKNEASAVALPTKDTIKEVNENGFVVKTLDRSVLWNMQTPQTIKFPLAKKAFENAKKDNFIGTDDISLVERLGVSAKIIQASENNFKITTPIDLELAKIILKNNKNV
ncbi:MAG: 2-C-methyl-D-erythritol 4-phosphate cytidylyltransferase [Candidatus Moranbacteria bacterium]|nr:2-C-methyl-D-erythritol 4-phosphate cytidylyltransferase [Candidatus Moranbacteria bacterium]